MTIFDSKGAALARAAVRYDEGANTIVLTKADAPSALLRYYFGHAGRRVALDLNGTRVTGRLETGWQGAGRVWFVRTDAPAPLQALPPARPVAEPNERAAVA